LAASELAWASMAAREGLHCTNSRLSENGGSGFGLGENALVLSEVNNIPSLFSLFLTFSFTLLEFSLIFPEKHTK